MPKRRAPPPVFRTKEERQGEVANIIRRLYDMDLTPVRHPEVAQLYAIMKEYVNDGTKDIPVNIPFPVFKKRIVGKLTICVSDPVSVKMVEMV